MGLRASIDGPCGKENYQTLPRIKLQSSDESGAKLKCLFTQLFCIPNSIISVLSSLTGRDHLKDPSKDGRILLSTVGEYGLIHLTQETDQWWALANTAINLWVP